MVASLLSFVAAVLVCGLLGAFLHEAAHYLVWLATGRGPRLDVQGLAVDWTRGPDRVEPRDRVAAVAPVLLGLLLLPVVVGVGGLPVWIGWLVLTLGGAREDWATAFAGLRG